MTALDISEDGALFRSAGQHDEAEAALDVLLDEDEAGRLAPGRYLARLRALAVRHPRYIDGHAHLAFALLNRGKPKLALEAAQRGYALGAEAIPPGYKGVIEWGWLENRPFLRAAHAAVLCHLRLRQRAKALALMEKMLAWNPNDNQGIRYIIGSEYLRAGDTERAGAIFDAEAGAYPPYRYEMALLRLREGAHAAAATALRHGFVENGYIAEILCGMPNPLPLAVWHGSNLAGSELAQDYVVGYGELWERTPGAIAFVRWLHTHPKAMAERAAVLECHQALLWERDFERRRRILNREDAAIAEIDDSLSAKIVVECVDRDGRPVFPWLYCEVER